jgi:anthranilate synthase component 2
VFSSVPEGFLATRYHSLAVERESLPGCLAVTAQSEDGEIMGLRHRSLAVEGVQFHPEALLTEHGHRMLQNFVEGRIS